MNSQNKCIAFRVMGKVQGVWFRAYARDNALSLNIDGWVKNDPDGSVFGEALGSETNIERFTHILREGSPSSRVEDVLFEDSPDKGQLPEFEIRF
jgi:acylphosphatase